MRNKEKAVELVSISK